MDINEIIRDCRDYIDAHLDEDLSVNALAAKYGYSPEYFGKAFLRCVGVSLPRFVLLARTSRAARDLKNHLRVTDVAIKYGYKTVAGFHFAFRSVYDVAPSVYSGEDADLLPVIECFAPIHVAGYILHRADGTKEHKAALWHGYDFSVFDPNDFNTASPEGGAEVGVWTEYAGERCYIFGVTCKPDATIPKNMVLCSLPPTEYAMFLVPPGENTHELYENINAALEPSRQQFESEEKRYILDPTRPSFEYYHEKETYLCIPLRENK